LVPLKPTPDLIFFRLRLVGIYPVLEDSDGVGFETIRYYLTINTIKDLYCAVLREIATTCDYAVTNCHGIYFPHSRSEILPKLLSPFETKLVSIKPLRLVANCGLRPTTTHHYQSANTHSQK
jgi:hypothetical protein